MGRHGRTQSVSFVLMSVMSLCTVDGPYILLCVLCPYDCNVIVYSG